MNQKFNLNYNFAIDQNYSDFNYNEIGTSINLGSMNVDFKFDGDMQPDVALSEEYKDLYPFSSIVGRANVLVMPGQHSAAISYKMMKTLGGAKVIGPLLIGLGRAIEIVPLRSSTSEILNLASVAAYSAGVINYGKVN